VLSDGLSTLALGTKGLLHSIGNTGILAEELKGLDLLSQQTKLLLRKLGG